MKVKIPTSVTTEQMEEIDHLVIYQYGIRIIQLVENTGHSLAKICRQVLGGRMNKYKIIVLAGSGRMVAGGMAAARMLHDWGAKTTVVLTLHEDALKKSALNQLNIIRSMDLEVGDTTSLNFISLHKFDLIVDALLGYKDQGSPSAEFANVIAAVNKSKQPVVSLDVPSGMDATTGRVFDPCIRASTTMAIGLPKTGLLREGAAEYTGDLWLADIGIPPETYTKIGMKVDNPFIEDDLVLLSRKGKAVGITA